MASLYCSKCGQQANDQQSFCSNCGNALAAVASGEKAGFWKRRTPVWAWIFIILPVAVFMAFFVASFFVPKEQIQRQAARDELEKRCATMLADSSLGDERRTVRAMCDAALKQSDEGLGRSR